MRSTSPPSISASTLATVTPGARPSGAPERGGVGARVVVRAEALGAAERFGEKIVEPRGARLERDQVEGAPAFARGAELGERRVARLGEEPLRLRSRPER